MGDRKRVYTNPVDLIYKLITENIHESRRSGI